MNANSRDLLLMEDPIYHIFYVSHDSQVCAVLGTLYGELCLKNYVQEMILASIYLSGALCLSFSSAEGVYACTW